MKRTAIERLIKWNQTSDVRPVLLTGSKGVGKTYLACDFAKSFFKRILYLNFEHDPYAIELFQANDPFLVSKRLLEYFKLDNTTDEAAIIEDRLLILMK